MGADRSLAILDTPLAEGTPLPAPSGLFPRVVEACLMLVDSHCHLDYFNQPGEVEAVVAARQGGGGGEMVTIGVTFAQSQTSHRHRREI